MIKYIVISVAIMIFLTILYNIDFDVKKVTMSKRKKQVKKMLRENVLQEKLDKIIEKNVKFSKRQGMEEKLIQAGFNISYTEYILICSLTAIVLSVLLGKALNNIFIGILFLIFGYLAPYQIVSFFRNKRILLLENQIGAFMQMVIKRYENTRDFNTALKMTSIEFEGEDPIDTEIKKAILEIDLGKSVSEALKNLAIRTGNKYMERFAAYYEIASEIGTDDVRKNLLTQAYEQYKENREMVRQLKKEISGPVQEAYIMILSVPIFAIYQIATNPDYIYIMTRTTIGRVGTAGVLGTLILTIWFVNAKLGAPLD